MEKVRTHKLVQYVRNNLDLFCCQILAYLHNSRTLWNYHETFSKAYRSWAMQFLEWVSIYWFRVKYLHIAYTDAHQTSKSLDPIQQRSMDIWVS